MTCATLTVEVEDSVALITINRPEVRNAVSREVVVDLQAAISALKGEDFGLPLQFTNFRD